jgi:small subunit ribosomal protein S20
MPHTRSAKKRLRQYEKRRLRNRATKKALKTQMKKVTEVLASGSAEQVSVEYNLLAKKLDKAAARRIVHPNLAARKKSQFARLIHDKAKSPAK